MSYRAETLYNTYFIGADGAATVANHLRLLLYSTHVGHVCPAARPSLSLRTLIQLSAGSQAAIVEGCSW
jgi:hypothetical protein